MRKAGINDLEREAWLRAREKGEIVWQTKDGRQIPIKEMTYEHLVNTIRMLIRHEEMLDMSEFPD